MGAEGRAAAVLEGLGCVVEEADPGFPDPFAAFGAWFGWQALVPIILMNGNYEPAPAGTPGRTSWPASVPRRKRWRGCGRTVFPTSPSCWAPASESSRMASLTPSRRLTARSRTGRPQRGQAVAGPGGLRELTAGPSDPGAEPDPLQPLRVGQRRAGQHRVEEDERGRDQGDVEAYHPEPDLPAQRGGRRRAVGVGKSSPARRRSRRRALPEWDRSRSPPAFCHHSSIVHGPKVSGNTRYKSRFIDIHRSMTQH